MKRAAAAAAAALSDDISDTDDAGAAPPLPAGADLCSSLLSRYANSPSPQHRHLCASAAAMRSILTDLALPLTPPAYFAAAITALRDTDRTDAAALSALSAFLSYLLPLVGADDIPPHRAKDAVDVVAEVLGEVPVGTGVGTVRSLVSSFGEIGLRVDCGDWGAVEVVVKTLLKFAVDKRPKVRRCAQTFVDKIFKALQSSIHMKKASKVVYSMYNKYIPRSKDLSSIKFRGAPQSKLLSKSEDMEFLHMLNIMKLLVPCLSEKVKMKLLSDVSKLLSGCYSWHTRHMLSLLQCLFEYLKIRDLVPESENIISGLTSYVIAGKKNPRDTVVCASSMLKTFLSKLQDTQPDICLKNLPLIVNSVAGLLGSDVTSKQVADILAGLINSHIDQSFLQLTPSQTCKDGKESTPEEIVTSICTSFNKIVGAYTVPTEYLLAVITVLFLKLGEFSYVCMKEIVLKLSQWAISVDKDTPEHLCACIGAAVVAMGPENFLSLVPITFNAEESFCSNSWLIPILKKYVVGATLQYFMDHIVPLAKAIQDASNRVIKKVQARKRLESYSCALWSLLPSFCCYPTDTSQSYESLANLLILVMKDNPSLHEIVAIALQKLVNSSSYVLKCNKDEEQCSDPTISFVYSEFHTDPRSLPFYYSKKTASRNMKALKTYSLGLFLALTDIFLESPPAKRKSMKEVIGCLASIIGDENLHDFFVSSLEKYKPLDTLDDSGKSECEVEVPNNKELVDTRAKRDKLEDMRCLLMELTSCFVEAANADLIGLIFGYIQSFLKASDETCHPEAYHLLSVILKEQNWFCVTRIEELMDLLLCMKSSADGVAMKNRLACYRYLLVHMLMRDEENMDPRAFLILNEIILILKSKKESRKLAYDVLLEISGSLKNSQPSIADTVLLRLFNMVMGYLSGPSPHIMSGAISALSLLIYNDASFCVSVPNLIPSVLVLLQNKDNEVIKAALGFIKVLVSSLSSRDLLKLLSDILNGILPWLAVSKHHFRSKVGVILEILMRKCGSETIESLVPEKYQRFLRKVSEAHQSKKSRKGDRSRDAAVQSIDSHASLQPLIGKKRVAEDVPCPVEKSSKSGSRNPRKKGKHEGLPSASGAKSFAGKDDSGQSLRSHGENPSVTRPTIKSKVERNSDDTPKGGNKTKVGKKINVKHDYVAEASISGARTKPNKRTREHNS